METDKSCNTNINKIVKSEKENKNDIENFAQFLVPASVFLMYKKLANTKF